MSDPDRLDFARIEALIRAQMSPVAPEGGPVSREDTVLFVLLALTQEMAVMRRAQREHFTKPEAP
jgi:hypothetical protein